MHSEHKVALLNTALQMYLMAQIMSYGTDYVLWHNHDLDCDLHWNCETGWTDEGEAGTEQIMSFKLSVKYWCVFVNAKNFIEHSYCNICSLSAYCYINRACYDLWRLILEEILRFSVGIVADHFTQ
jgi:hypothetical protein